MNKIFDIFDNTTSQTKKHQKLVMQAVEILKKVKAENTKIALSFSGGKDSTAALILCLKAEIYPELVWFNSGYEYPETENYIKVIAEKFNLFLREIKPEIDPLQAKINAGFFDLEVIQKVNKKILNPWWSTNKEYDCIITGLRIQESNARRITILKNGQYFYNKTFQANACYPVAFMDAKDVFAIIKSNGLEPHPIYHKAKTIQERDWLRVNWYILTAAERGFYVFLKREYPEQFNILAKALPEVRCYV